MSHVSSTEAKLEAVTKGARAILHKQTFVGSARAIFNYCCEMTGAVSGYVALLSADGHENEVLFLEAGGLPCTVNPDLPMPIRGLRNTVYESGKAAYENNFMQSDWAKMMPEGHVELRNVMFSPLNLEEVTVGIIGLANKPVDFTDADAEIATVFGELAAIALKINRHIDLLEAKTKSLETALTQVRALQGLLPMCSHCSKIRDDKGYWTRVEAYLSEHTDAQISHGLCPDCLMTLYPEVGKKLL